MVGSLRGESPDSLKALSARLKPRPFKAVVSSISAVLINQAFSLIEDTLRHGV